VQFPELLDALGVTDPDGDLAAHWEESLATLPLDAPTFLRPERISEWREFCRISPEVDGVLHEAARVIDGDPHLRAFAWHLYRRLYVHVESGGFSDWPSLDRRLPDAPDAVYLLVCLAAVPGTLKAHAHLGVPLDITRDTMLEVKCFAANYADWTGGRVGIIKSQVFWLRHYPAGRLFRVGRFEFMIQPFRGDLSVYRHRESGKVVALSGDGVTYDARGYIPIPGLTDQQLGFTARLEESDGAATGNVVSPRGIGLPERVRLSLAEWEPVLSPGDLTLDMHIPSGGGMTPEACQDAMVRGLEFFARTFPDRPVSTVSCFSWIYNPELETILGNDSNLVRHLKELYLFPIRSTGRDGLFFLFYDDDIDPKTARRDTSVRRAVLDHLNAGGRLRSSGMFALGRDLSDYGMGIYRRDWPAEGLPPWLAGLRV
jgi:hypothetical protein